MRLNEEGECAFKYVGSIILVSYDLEVDVSHRLSEVPGKRKVN